MRSGRWRNRRSNSPDEASAVTTHRPAAVGWASQHRPSVNRAERPSQGGRPRTESESHNNPGNKIIRESDSMIVQLVPTACLPVARAWPQARNLPRGHGLPENNIRLANSRRSRSYRAPVHPLKIPVSCQSPPRPMTPNAPAAPRRAGTVSARPNLHFTLNQHNHL